MRDLIALVRAVLVLLDDVRRGHGAKQGER